MASDYPGQRRNVVAGIVVGLIAIAAILLIVTRLVGGNTTDQAGGTPALPAPSNVATSPSSTPTTSADPGSSSCGLPDGDQSIPTSAPAAQWTLGPSGVAAPTSRKIGPGVVTRGLHTCFARSPTGALFALADYAVDTADPDVSNADLATRYFKDAAHPSPPDLSDRDPGTKAVQIAGFQILDYTPQRASVAIALRGTTSQALASVTLTVGWQNGDWRVVVPSADLPASALETLDGYVAWSGVS